MGKNERHKKSRLTYRERNKKKIRNITVVIAALVLCAVAVTLFYLIVVDEQPPESAPATELESVHSSLMA